jgi:hypothetical protein
MIDHKPGTTGARGCDTCLFHHPEKPRKPCSVFGRCVTHDNCCAYISNGSTDERRKNE